MSNMSLSEKRRNDFPQNEFLLTLALSRLSFLSCAEKILIQKKLDNIRDLALLSIKDISIIISRSVSSRAGWHPDKIEKLAASDARLMEAFHISFCRCDSNKYPSLLAEIYDPPYTVFYRGDISILDKSCIGIVGTRKPSLQGMKSAFLFAGDAAKDGRTVVSGLAYGIDACAHKGSLSSNGKTAAVLACGVDSVYPKGNRKLAESMILSGGCILSEYAPNEAPVKYRFPQRNRLISGLSESVVVIQAPVKSGALITADFALEQGRDVFIHKSALSLNTAGSTNGGNSSVYRYIEDGAPVVESFSEFKAVQAENIGLNQIKASEKSQQMLDFGSV